MSNEITDTKGRLIAMPSWHASNDKNYPLKPESEANARLMAAAPDLLEALQLAHDRMNLADWNMDTIGSSRRLAFDKATEAIAKATSPSPAGEKQA